MIKLALLLSRFVVRGEPISPHPPACLARQMQRGTLAAGAASVMTGIAIVGAVVSAAVASSGAAAAAAAVAAAGADAGAGVAGAGAGTASMAQEASAGAMGALVTILSVSLRLVLFCRCTGISSLL